MKAKLPHKKAKGQSDELEEIDDDSTDSSQIGERTNVTDITDLDEGAGEATSDSLIHKLKNKIKTLNKGKTGKSADTEEESQEDSSADAAKKKKRLFVQVALGITAVMILFYDDMFPPETPPTAVSSFKKPERKKPASTAVPAEATNLETPPGDTTPTDVSNAENTEPTPTETAPESGADDIIITETTPDSPVTVTSESAPPVETTEPAPVETSLTEEEPISLGEPETNYNANVDSVDGGETTIPGDENLTDQILQDLEKQAKSKQAPEQKKEYVAPPDYEYRGRGLVYNCKGKHWACIDAPSYKTCEDNASSVKYLNKKSECHPFNVYETTRGCENIQNRKVSSSAKTNFCND